MRRSFLLLPILALAAFTYPPQEPPILPTFATVGDAATWCAGESYCPTANKVIKYADGSRSEIEDADATDDTPVSKQYPKAGGTLEEGEDVYVVVMEESPSGPSSLLVWAGIGIIVGFVGGYTVGASRASRASRASSDPQSMETA